MAEKPIEILVVGQTPPPYGGQAVMMQTFLDGPYQKLHLHHLRMAYSADMSDIGRFNSRKILHLCELIFLTYARRLRIGPCYLLYPPASPNLFPLVRDIVYLLCTRWLFLGTIFHYHSAGVSERVAGLPAPLRQLANLAYGRATCSIRPSPYSADDPRAFLSRHAYIVPNAITDHASLHDAVPGKSRATRDRTPRILSVGVLRESKGTLVLLDALAILVEQGFLFEADLVGEIEDETVRRGIDQRMENVRLRQSVTLHGVLVGEAKWKVFREADIFVFPTFFESFGLVAVEAMQFAIPVVATRCQGVQSVVVDGETGFLTPIRDPGATAEAIARLLRDPELARRMGKAGRARYLAEFRLESFWERIEQAIVEAVSNSRKQAVG